MSKMQGGLNFQTIDEFLEFLPSGERRIVEALREIILECVPECREKLSYNVPYYFRHYRLCYIWPSAVPWGNLPLEGVQLGFANGHLLPDEAGFLEKGKRKQVYVHTYRDLREIDFELVSSYVFEAVAIDERLRQEKRKSR